MFFFCECCLLSDRGLCDKLITRPEESYGLWCVVVCDLETSKMRRSWPALGRSTTAKKKNLISSQWSFRFCFADHNFRCNCYIWTYYYNICPTRCNFTQFILSGNCFTYLGWYYHPSSGAHTTIYSIWYLSHRCCYLPLIAGNHRRM
jgi:hypothetical protein